MADHSYGVFTSKHATTDADDVDTIVFTGTKAGFRLQNHSTSAGLYYTWGATAPSTPASDGSTDGSYYLEPGGSDTRSGVNGPVVLKVTSTAAVPYSAETWAAATALPLSSDLVVGQGDGSTWVQATGNDVELHVGATTALASSATATTLPSGAKLSLGGILIIPGSGSPEGVVTAPVGSLYLRSNGGSGTSVYRKESGSGNTGWVASNSGSTIDTTGHATTTTEPYWDEASSTVKLRAATPVASLARKLDIRAAGYGAKIDGRLVAGATTSGSTSTTVSFSAAHNITNADIGKTGWVLDSTGNGTARTISAVPTTTTITLSGQCGKTISSGGQFVYGTPINTAAAAALADAGNMVTVDTGAGANKPWGPTSGVEVYCGGGTGIAILTAQLSVPRGVRWNNDGIIYGGQLTSSPFFLLGSNSSIGRLTIDVGSSKGLLWGDSTSSSVHGSWQRIEIWNRGGDSTKHLVELDGLDYQGNEIWTKGGGTAVRCVSGTDSNLGHIFAIGASTGVAVSAGSQITGKIFSDSCSCALRIWGGADNVHLDVQAFMTSASVSGTTKVVVFGTKDDGTTSTSLNQNIRLHVQARDIGETVVNLNYCQNVTVTGQLAPRMSSGAIVESARGTMTGVNYGTSVGDGVSVDLSFPSLTQTLDDNTTPAYSLYSGTKTGVYVAKFDDQYVFVNGGPYRMTGGTATAPTLTAIT